MEKGIKAVVKIEIETLYGDNDMLSLDKMEHLSMVCTNLQNSGSSLILVSSGAIALGARKMGMKELPAGITVKQAVAAIGQAELIISYQNCFEKFDQMVAQVLLTKDVVDNPVRNLNAKNTLKRLLEKCIIPVVNENDSVSTNDIIINDNYPLVLIVASLTEADAVVVTTEKQDVFKLILRNSSSILQITLEELLNLPQTIEAARLQQADNIKGFPEFYQTAGIN